MSVKRTPLKLAPALSPGRIRLASPMSRPLFRSEFFYSPLAMSGNRVDSSAINFSFDPLSVSYEFNQVSESV